MSVLNYTDEIDAAGMSIYSGLDLRTPPENYH